MATIPLQTAGRTAEITFAALEDVLPRLAWQNEAVTFTPWLGADCGRERDGGRYLFYNYVRTDTREQANWADAADWLKREVDLYRGVLGELLQGTHG